MKVLHVVPSFGFGGMEKVICSIINHTSSQYNHTILILGGNKEATKWITRRNITIVDFNKPPRRLAFFKVLYKILKNMKPDLLMTYNWGTTDAIWLGRLAGISNVIHHEHGFNIDEANHTDWRRNVVRFFVYRMALKIVVVSHELEERLRRVYHINNNKIVYIPNGVNTEIYKPNCIERDETRKLLGLQETNFVAGFLGRLDPVKNFDLMLDICMQCVKRDLYFRLLIVGDGPEKGRIEKVCQLRNIQDHIVFVGQKDNVIPYLRALDAVILTSFREQMPMTLLEAMSVGLPVVATHVGEIPHIVEHEQEGFVKELDTTPEEFAISLLALKNPDTYARMGRAARQKIVTAFREEVMIQQYKELIDSRGLSNHYKF